ncbi:hypothetical protein PFICI_14397 [Pestalotiopsis fici W106-1]|uniref:Uncharacterized protein n=1 Tax=Pestalotiopsis fici (strain W106-1 / CGMCC3.15140) TaxID=1229662 RepID=W3WNY4_PESFW|nr:uncharacterized protein PFICI_14397 [Pestalotiopsis fici W106-1]ETS74531.1 hypothetical protein PFICI_14397 [Pestalotiopsis fici W106-1]
MSAETDALSPSSPPPICRIEDTHVSNFTVSGKAIVRWELDGVQNDQYLFHPDPKNRSITFEVCVENDASQLLAFFRLRVPVRLKQKDTILYIHIPPDHIASLSWSLQCEASSSVQAKLSSSITSLHFNLSQPAHLIVPAQWTVLHPRRALSADIIKALESLATSRRLTIYLEHATLSKSRLQAITNIVQSRSSRPVPSYCHLHRLYEGTGGKRHLPIDENNVSTDSEAAPETQGESPPAYNEIGPGPPMPPTTPDCPWAINSAKGHGKRHRQSGSADTDGGESESPSNRPSKRGSGEQDSGSAARSTGDGNDLLQLCQRLFVELADVKQVAARQEKTIQELQDKVAILEEQARAREDKVSRLQAEARTQQDDILVLEQRLDKGDAAVVDLDATVVQHDDTLAELEQSVAALQEYCDDFAVRRVPEMDELRDELRAEVMGRLRSALESP